MCMVEKQKQTSPAIYYGVSRQVQRKQGVVPSTLHISWGNLALASTSEYAFCFLLTVRKLETPGYLEHETQKKSHKPRLCRISLYV